MDLEEILTYSYDVNEFFIHTEKGNKSQFDNLLESSWNNKKEKNHFRFTLEETERRIIPGKYGFIAELNIKRAFERRKPQFMSNIIMEFDPKRFHFGKVDKNEILFQLEPMHWEIKVQNRNQLLINVSPLGYCSSLLVPSIDKCYPQVLNFEAIRLALETVVLSLNPDLKVGMNSLGAYASVNHLHFHLYYLTETLYLQFCKMKHLKEDCYEAEDYPMKAFAFQLLQKEDIQSTARTVMKVVEIFQKEEIAHNILITRGKDFNDSTSKQVFNAIRIFVFYRKSYFGSKDDISFNPALCELSGHLLIKERHFYETATEEDVVSILEEICCEKPLIQ